MPLWARAAPIGCLPRAPPSPSFAEVLARTSLPHALEHLVIDLQAANPACASDATFVGTTEWLSKRDGLARVTVNFTDDLIALGALKDALALLEGTVE